MNNDVKSFVTEKVNELLNAASCCAEAKAAGKNWLDALEIGRASCRERV